MNPDSGRQPWLMAGGLACAQVHSARFHDLVAQIRDERFEEAGVGQGHHLLARLEVQLLDDTLRESREVEGELGLRGRRQRERAECGEQGLRGGFHDRECNGGPESAMKPAGEKR